MYNQKMKNVFLRKVVLLAVLGCVYVGVLRANERRSENRRAPVNVLMLGLTDNVRSNYFPKVMISEETGIEEELIDREYNAVIMENITASANGAYKFVSADADAHKWVSLIRVNGEADESYSDVSQAPLEEFRMALEMAEADYLLVINQHYLKWQERPMRTLFHIVSYSLFDKEQNEVYRGNHHFTSMYLECPEGIRRISRRATSRIASTIVNQIR